MSHPDLVKVWARLDHADRHHAALMLFIDSYLSGGRIRPRFNYDEEASVFTVTVDNVAVPSEIALAAGDVLQCVRAALNNVVMAMLRRAGVTPTRAHQFPMESRSNSRGRSDLVKMVAGISAGDLKLVTRYQPTSVTESERPFHPLRQLRELTNWDKHQELLLPGVTMHTLKRDAFGKFVRVSSLAELPEDEDYDVYAPYPDVNGTSVQPYVTRTTWGGAGDPDIWRLELMPLPANPVWTYPQPFPLGVRIACETAAVDDMGIARIQRYARDFVGEVEKAWISADAN